MGWVWKHPSSQGGRFGLEPHPGGPVRPAWGGSHSSPPCLPLSSHPPPTPRCISRPSRKPWWWGRLGEGLSSPRWRWYPCGGWALCGLRPPSSQLSPSHGLALSWREGLAPPLSLAFQGPPRPVPDQRRGIKARPPRLSWDNPAWSPRSRAPRRGRPRSLWPQVSKGLQDHLPAHEALWPQVPSGDPSGDGGQAQGRRVGRGADAM